mmetsp:Transcript_5930/g.14750  ORF Transcript_5930/g.14750 Transcript_5930/m.14750 type:complete len:82 (-) Transcript_5930:90-335(-)
MDWQGTVMDERSLQDTNAIHSSRVGGNAIFRMLSPVAKRSEMTKVIRERPMTMIHGDGLGDKQLPAPSSSSDADLSGQGIR